MRINRSIVLFGLPLILGACTWVSVQPAARDVLVLPQNRIHNCKYLGKTEVSVADKVAIFNRFSSDVEKDLQDLARNQAVGSGGDTVSALDTVKDGHQTFGIYKCVPNQGKSVPAKQHSKNQGAQTTPYKPPH